MKESHLKIEEIKEKNNKKINSLDNTYITHNKYSGKKKSYICYVPKTLIVLIFLLPSLVFFNVITTFDSFLGIVFLVFVCIGLMIFNRIKVTPKGIKHLRKFYEWEEIQTIGVAVTKKGLPHKFYRKVIYISKEKYEMPIHLSYQINFENELKNPIKNIQIIFFTYMKPYLIRASFNRRLIHHIIAYWGTDIKNLNDAVGWYSYLRFYNFIHRNKKTKF